MRTPKSLSYSSMTLWEKNPEEFYLRYLADHAAPRLPQEPPMAVGSSFDAHVKANLYEALFGKTNPKFEFAAIFESQVEPQCRDFALVAGQVCFDAYKLTGSLRRVAGAVEAIDRAAPLRVQGGRPHQRRPLHR